MSASVWTDKDKVAAAELNQLMREAGARLASVVIQVAGDDLKLRLEEEFADLELPEPSSDAHGRLTFAFQCGVADELVRQLQELREVDDAPADAEEAQPARA